MVDHPTGPQLDEILRQMKEEGRTFADEMADYSHGEDRVYGYDADEATWFCKRTDTVVGSYVNRRDPVTETELREILAGFSLRAFEQQGFRIPR